MPPSELVAWLQLGVLIAGLTGVLVRIGRKDESLTQATNDIHELTHIVKDLVRSQVESEVHQQHFKDTLVELRKRLDRLEASRWGATDRTH